MCFFLDLGFSGVFILFFIVGVIDLNRGNFGVNEFTEFQQNICPLLIGEIALSQDLKDLFRQRDVHLFKDLREDQRSLILRSFFTSSTMLISILEGHILSYSNTLKIFPY